MMRYALYRARHAMVAAFCLLIGTLVCAAPNAVLWQLGKVDDSCAEFSNYRAANPEVVAIPADWQTRTDWSGISKGMRASVNPAMNLTFSLPSVPKYGVLFSFKLLNAQKNGEELAVFSNGVMAGLIQLWGSADTGCQYKWQKTYQLYIPKEMLQAGQNELRFEAPRPIWSDVKSDPLIWWEWDYLKLEALSAPATEPIHGKMTYMGTTLTQADHDFYIDARTVQLAPIMFEWMGIAYSGNTIRANFWKDVTWQQPARLEYLQTLRNLNMSVIMDYLSGGHFSLTPQGTMPDNVKADLQKFFATYGQYFQYYEIGNEMLNFGDGILAKTMVTVKEINELKPAHVKTTTIGYAYNKKGGVPSGWEGDPAVRRDIESYCQATNGHSYGYSYNDLNGGSFCENLKTYQGVQDGWPKEYVNTETGNNDWHSEENGSHLPSTQPHISNFDRILRAHVAVVDRFMQHAAIFGDCTIFKAPNDWSKMTTLTAYPGVGSETENHLMAYRRLALAYATHGVPLPYTYRNKADIQYKRVYFRAVDTSKLAPLPGSGATANKILLNFVNFEGTPQTMQVRVIMPQKGIYSGTRVGPGDTYAAAFSSVTLTAQPALDLTVTLKAHEAVQYILSYGKNPPASPVVEIPTPDLVVTEAHLDPANAKAGDEVNIVATIKNIGKAATPAGTVHGIKFMIDGKDAFWCDNYKQSIPAGGSVTLTANGGANKKSTWTVPPGPHTLSANVDDVDRMCEMNEQNNVLTTTVTVAQ